MNSNTGLPIVDTGGGGSDLSGGGSIPVGGPANGDDAAFVFQVGNTDVWTTGIDSADAANTRPYKIARGSDISLNERFELADTGQMTLPFYTTVGDHLTVTAGGVITSTTPAGGVNNVSKAVVNVAGNIIARTDGTGGRAIKEAYTLGNEPTFSDAGQLSMPFHTVPGEVLTVGASGLITSAAAAAGIDTRQLGTGVFSGGVISINGANLFDVSAATGQITDGVTGTVTPVSFIAAVGLVHLVGGVSFIFVNGAATIVQSTSRTNQQTRNMIYLGYVSHDAGTLPITQVVNEQATLIATPNQLHDFMKIVGPLNASGNTITSASATDNALLKEGGSMVNPGVNFITDVANPHVLVLPQLDTGAGATFDYIYIDPALVDANRTVVNPFLYDDGSGVLGANIANLRWGVTRVYITPNNDLLLGINQILNGSTSSAAAIATITEVEYIVPDRIQQRGGMLIAYIVQRGNSPDFDTNCTLLQVGKYGQSTGVVGGGTGSATLQSAYDNASEILTGVGTAVKMRRGTAAETDNVLEIRSNANVVTASIQGDGAMALANGLTVAAGGATVTAGGLSVVGGGASLTGTFVLPSLNTVGHLLSIADGGGTITSVAPAAGGAGDVVGPAGATDNTIARYDAATGKLIQGSGVAIDDSDNITIPAGAMIQLGNNASDPTGTTQGQMYWNTISNRIRVWNGAIWASVTTDAPNEQLVTLTYVDTCDNVNHVQPNAQGVNTVNGVYNATEGQECNDFVIATGLATNFIAADTIAYTGGATTVSGHWSEYSFTATDRLTRVILYTRANLATASDRDFSQFTVLFSTDAGATWTIAGRTELEVTADITWVQDPGLSRSYTLDFTETTGLTNYNRMRIVQTKALASGSGSTSITEVELIHNI